MYRNKVRIFSINDNLLIEWDQILNSAIPMGWLNEPEFISEFWSGMTDPNGMDIYENDLVRDVESIGQVVFHTGSFHIDFGDYSIPLYGNQGIYKVVGNIHVGEVQ